MSVSVLLQVDSKIQTMAKKQAAARAAKPQKAMMAMKNQKRKGQVMAAPKGKPKGKAMKINKKQKLNGPADSLVGDAWKCWIQHLERRGPTWLVAFTTLSHLLCARVTEIMKLKLERTLTLRPRRSVLTA